MFVLTDIGNVGMIDIMTLLMGICVHIPSVETVGFARWLHGYGVEEDCSLQVVRESSMVFFWENKNKKSSCLLLRDKTQIEDLCISIGVMKDFKLKLRDLCVWHTLGCVMVNHDITPVSGTIPVSVIPIEKYLKIFPCVLEKVFLSPDYTDWFLIQTYTTIHCVGDWG